MDYRESRFESRRIYIGLSDFEKKLNHLAIYAVVASTFFIMGYNAANPPTPMEEYNQDLTIRQIYSQFDKDINHFLDKLRDK